MILKGILGNSLNGQLCLRGFANIKDLARVSKADYTYQRNPIDRSDISDFLEKQSYLFFPEIILGYKLIPIKPSETPLQLIQEGKNARTTNGTFSVKKIANESEKFVTVEIDETKDPKPFSRIDGNHRLLAAEKSGNSKVASMTAPFCLLLGPDTIDFDKATKVFFYNINTKTIPLTSEENLKVLINDEKNFPNEELQDIFGGEYPIKTRELIQQAKPDIFSNIQHILKNYRTCYNGIFKYLLDNDESLDNVVEKVLNSLQAVNILYGSEPKLKSNESIGILTAFLYYHVKDESAKFELFKNWILNNQIFKVEEISADNIIKIFDEIVSSEIKVFVAMPYWNGDATIVRDYNTIYENSVNKIREEYKLNISVYPIMENKGSTKDLIQDIINKIKNCKIFIADTTDNNPNVMYETGWARALNKEVLLFRKKGSVKPKSDYQNDSYYEYDDNARAVSLGELIYEHLTAILKENFGLIKK